MNKFFSKAAAVFALVGAVLGLSIGAAQADITQVEARIVSQSSDFSPLYLDQARSLVDQKQGQILAGHSSHYSHQSHQSHQSHYSHRSGY